MYLWKPNDTEIENYRISADIALLKGYIRESYYSVTVFEIVFEDYYSGILVKEKWIDGRTYELGFIAEIEELK